MNMIHTEAYRTAFSAYLRKGTPIPLSLKQAGTTARYVWRCQGDNFVRPAHRANDGRVFAWDNPPDTGHPGEDYNCRCAADPYILGETEFAFHEFTSDFPSGPVRCGNREFVSHYYFADGRAVTLEEIGHLREIAEQYAYADGAQGSFRRLSGQIPTRLEKMEPESFTCLSITPINSAT